MACAFCLTGKMGLVRHLSAGEIAGQVRVLAEALGLRQSRFNIVLMGMGEPLHNYDATMKALRILNDEEGLAINPRRVTLSTVGIVPMLDKLAQEPLMPNLAVSLHATTEGSGWPSCRRPRVLSARHHRSLQTVSSFQARPHHLRVRPARRGQRFARRRAPVGQAPGRRESEGQSHSAQRRRGHPVRAALGSAGGSICQHPGGQGSRSLGAEESGRDIRAACGQLIVEGQGTKRSPGQRLAAAL